MTANSRNLLATTKEAISDISFTHLWDETRCKFRRYQEVGRASKMGVWLQTMAQRGFFTFTLVNKDNGESNSTKEAWLARPIEVEGSSGGAMLPAIESQMPEGFSTHYWDRLQRTANTCSHLTIMPLCDKASGNISMLKFWGHRWAMMLEALPTVCKMYSIGQTAAEFAFTIGEN